VQNIVFDGSFSKEFCPGSVRMADYSSSSNRGLICRMSDAVSLPPNFFGSHRIKRFRSLAVDGGCPNLAIYWLVRMLYLNHLFAFLDEALKNYLFHDLQFERMHDERCKRNVARFVSSER